eukprot:SAG31_NODE_78_length_27447_cov_83.819877_5_plen_835_part_00
MLCTKFGIGRADQSSTRQLCLASSTECSAARPLTSSVGLLCMVPSMDLRGAAIPPYSAGRVLENTRCPLARSQPCVVGVQLLGSSVDREEAFGRRRADGAAQLPAESMSAKKAKRPAFACCTAGSTERRKPTDGARPRVDQLEFNNSDLSTAGAPAVEDDGGDVHQAVVLDTDDEAETAAVLGDKLSKDGHMDVFDLLAGRMHELGAEAPGVFRRADGTRDTAELYEKLRAGQKQAAPSSPAFAAALADCDDVQVVAGVMMKWLTELDPHVVPEHCHQQWAKIAAAHPRSWRDLAQLVEAMPEAHRQLLVKLVWLLRKIIDQTCREHAEKQAQVTEQACILVAPTLIHRSGGENVADSGGSADAEVLVALVDDAEFLGFAVPEAKILEADLLDSAVRRYPDANLVHPLMTVQSGDTQMEGGHHGEAAKYYKEARGQCAGEFEKFAALCDSRLEKVTKHLEVERNVKQIMSDSAAPEPVALAPPQMELPSEDSMPDDNVVEAKQVTSRDANCLELYTQCFFFWQVLRCGLLRVLLRVSFQDTVTEAATLHAALDNDGDGGISMAEFLSTAQPKDAPLLRSVVLLLSFATVADCGSHMVLLLAAHAASLGLHVLEARVPPGVDSSALWATQTEIAVSVSTLFAIVLRKSASKVVVDAARLLAGLQAVLFTWAAMYRMGVPSHSEFSAGLIDNVLLPEDATKLATQVPAITAVVEMLFAGYMLGLGQVDGAGSAPLMIALLLQPLLMAWTISDGNLDDSIGFMVAAAVRLLCLYRWLGSKAAAEADGKDFSFALQAVCLAGTYLWIMPWLGAADPGILSEPVAPPLPPPPRFSFLSF